MVSEESSDNTDQNIPKQNILEIINDKLDSTFSPKGKKIFVILLALVLIAGVSMLASPKSANTPQDQGPSILDTQAVNTEVVVSKKADDDIEIVIDDEMLQNDSSMTSMSLDDYGRANPFLPESEAFSDVRRYGFDLMAPPGSITTDSEASKVMTTKVSGIMYDPKNPSAILNIEGEDYFVHSGDFINSYRILAINKDAVTVQLGMNVYKARVGEVIADGTITNNNVYNLENKFGGARR